MNSSDMAAGWDFSISVFTLVVSTASSIFLGCLAFLTLKFTAQPKLKIRIVSESSRPVESVFACGERVVLHFNISNMGRWYAKPVATHIRLYFNFDPQCEPIEIRYGSTLEKSENKVRWGKAYSRYLKISGIHLSYGEVGEETELVVKMPTRPGNYKCWVSAFCDQGGCGVHHFPFEVS
jgi:hypothetical protein